MSVAIACLMRARCCAPSSERLWPVINKAISRFKRHCWPASAAMRILVARAALFRSSGQPGSSIVAHVLSLTSGARRQAGSAYSVVAALFVRKATLDLPHPIKVLATHYQLTPTELRVLMAVVQVGGVPEIADVLGVSRTTVKTHLSRLFDKTGTSRQADLVRIVAGFAGPIA